MARFSVFGDDDEDDREGEGPSSPRQKRRRSPQASCSYSNSSDDEFRPQRLRVEVQPYEDLFCALARTPSEEEEEEQQEEEEEEEEEEGYVSEFFDYSSMMGPAPTHASSVPTNSDKSVPVVLTDPDVLDCFICFEPLTIPVYQCENGHIACSSCCTKISNKCPSCSWPIGYNRCRAIEKVLESVKIACQNAQYGCKETVTYSKKKDHEKTCTYSPCSCPFRTCNFVSSSEQLYLHVSGQHFEAAVHFGYNSSFSVTLKDSDDFLVLQGREDNVLFILNSNVESLGSVVWVSCIWPCSFKGFFYELKVKTAENSLRLQSFTNCSQARVDVRPSNGYLLIPKDLFGSDGQLKLCLYIRLLD